MFHSRLFLFSTPECFQYPPFCRLFFTPSLNSSFHHLLLVLWSHGGCRLSLCSGCEWLCAPCAPPSQLLPKMSDSAAASPPAAAAPAKKAAKKSPKVAKPVEHPKYSEMVAAAVATLKDRKGSSAQAIKKYIAANYKVDEKSIGTYVRSALKRGLSSGQLTQVKGSGANGSFKLAEPAKPKKEKAAKSPKKTTPKKAAAKKPAKSPAKKVAKTSTKKAAKSPAKKTPTKSPKKAAKKAAKSPAKKPVAKKAKKPAAKKATTKK
ncbi:Linker histone H1/H5 domain H15 [Trinorchestia longiramus]|nr:Linker histone H1/H5 domain H15 [Trinorchestia longiramus]